MSLRVFLQAGVALSAESIRTKALRSPRGGSLLVGESVRYTCSDNADICGEQSIGIITKLGGEKAKHKNKSLMKCAVCS